VLRRALVAQPPCQPQTAAEEHAVGKLEAEALSVAVIIDQHAAQGRRRREDELGIRSMHRGDRQPYEGRQLAANPLDLRCFGHSNMVTDRFAPR